MNPTAFDLPEVRPDRTLARSESPKMFGDVPSVAEVYMAGLTSSPLFFVKHAALREWSGEKARRLWVDLDATGATAFNPESYRRLTPGHSAIHVLPIELVEILAQLDALIGQSPGSSGYDVAAPKTSSILQAKAWIREMYEDVRRFGSDWMTPLTTVDEFGDIVFEWWHGSRKITVYVTPETVEYIKVSGPNMHTDMDDGELSTREDRQNLWQWLTSID
jgi:hypothetical protein